MITYSKAKKLLPPGDVVYTVNSQFQVIPATVLEVCAGWLRTTAGNLDFQDHGYTWWLTERAAMENLC
jgi:hypothetical protein